MPRRWKINIRRKDGSRCNHFSDEPCQACEDDKKRPLAKPYAVSFGLTAEQLEQTVFAPWEKPHSIDSRSELLQFCESHQLDSKYLKESMIWPHRKPREV